MTSVIQRLSLIALLANIIWIGEAQSQHSQKDQYSSRTSEAVAVKMQHTLLADALLNLAENRKLELAYVPDLVAGQPSDCPVLPAGNQEAIQCLLNESGLVVKQLTNGVFVIHKPSLEGNVLHGAVHGKVLNRERGEALAGAHITLNGTPHSTASGSGGGFEIERVPPGLYDLCVSMVGYETMCFKELHIIAGEALDVELRMEEATLLLEEIMITSDGRRRRVVLPDTLNPLDYQGIRFGTVSAGLFLSSQPTTVKGVQLSGVGSMSRDSLRGVQFGGVFNSAASASRGAQFGGVFNTVGGDLDGYQFSGVLNQLGGDLSGGQFAGTVNVAGAVRGIQSSGIANMADGDVRGVQGAGIVNVSAHLRGAQFAGIANQAKDTRGFQGAGILNMASSMSGMQGSGIVNVSDGRFSGVQAAGIANVAREMQKGVQVAGIVNVAGHMRKGAQIGLVNFALSNEGLPLGIFSYIRETGLRYDAWVDETGMVTTAVRSGNRRFSNYLGVSASPDAGFGSRAYLVGLGGEFRLGRSFYGALESFYYGMDWESSDDEEHLVRLRWLFGYRPTSWLGIFAGPSLNARFSNNPETDLAIPGRITDGHSGSVYYDVWPGFAFGVRIFGRP